MLKVASIIKHDIYNKLEGYTHNVDDAIKVLKKSW